MNAIALRTSSKKRDNKGFSLVELIIVIAIMAVLTAILAPQLLRYVERSRAAKDATTLDEVQRAASIALADEATYVAVAGATADASGNIVITLTYTGSTGVIAATGGNPAGVTALCAEMARTLGGTATATGITGLPTLVSRARLAAPGTVAFTVTLAGNGNVSVTY